VLVTYNTLIAAVMIGILLQGCSGFRFNAMMCDQLRSDPTRPIPQECRNYSEEEAARASEGKKKEPCIDCTSPEPLEFERE
jgi:hypothetical protein